jgi:hypothetical protein
MNRAQRTGQKEYSAFLPASTEPVAEEENLLGHWIWVIQVPSTAKENVSIRLPSGEFSVLHGLTSQAPCNGSSAVGGICCILSPPCAPARTSARAPPRVAKILVEGRAKRLIPPIILPVCCVEGVWGEVRVRHARRRGPEGPARVGRGDPRYRYRDRPKAFKRSLLLHASRNAGGCQKEQKSHFHVRLGHALLLGSAPPGRDQQEVCHHSRGLTLSNIFKIF